MRGLVRGWRRVGGMGRGGWIRVRKRRQAWKFRCRYLYISVKTA